VNSVFPSNVPRPRLVFQDGDGFQINVQETGPAELVNASGGFLLVALLRYDREGGVEMTPDEAQDAGAPNVP